MSNECPPDKVRLQFTLVYDKDIIIISCARDGQIDDVAQELRILHDTGVPFRLKKASFCKSL